MPLTPFPPSPSAATAPDGMPQLSRGRHRDPTRGACFMEYTATLAGEPFSDSPRCVDPELAAVLRSANDLLSDRERPALVPLLGRAIGLVVERPEEQGSWVQRLRRRARGEEDPSAAQVSRLHESVSERFEAAVGLPPSDAWGRWYGRSARVSELFWDLMSEPVSPRHAEDYATRLVRRLDVLHRCYEDVLAEMGLRPTPADTPPRPAVPSPRPSTTPVR